jgi:TolB-like protein/class 3 adenylate cyclase/Tol biopolymer transport system component/tetratricopeptide (TPR) repeat protein
MTEKPDNIVPITGEDEEAAKRYLEQYGQELVTILFTDLVDSTQLQSDLGNVESAKITDLHRGIVRDELAKSNGREIEWAGDSCLAVFSKPSDAVVFALRMQAEHALVRKTEKRLPTVRVGMHLGEIVVKQGEKKEDLYGLQVSEAARVMSIARGNQVFCTRAVFDSARSSLKGQTIEGIGDAVWVNYGAYLLKGSEEPVEICEIGSSEVAVMKAPEATDKVFPLLPGGNPMRASEGTPKWAAAIIFLLMAGVAMLGIQLLGGSPEGGSTRTASTDEPIDSIAVLPFLNQSDDDGQEYFVDGMTGAITSELSKISSLKVIGRASAMTYKGTEKSPGEIAAELGVDGLITGTAFRAGDDVRITAELVDARTGAQEWSKEYDATMDNVLEVHSDVALAVSEAIRTVVTPEEQARLSQSYDTDPAAYDEYLRGVARMGSRSHEGLRAAIAHFERAVALDPKFAPAFARLADSHSLLGMYWYEDVDDVYPKAKEFALKAIDLDENSSEAYTALGLVEGVYLLNLVSAERLYLRALEIDPNYANAHMWYSNLLTWLGRNNEASIHVDRLTELLPNDVVAQTQRALTDFAVSDFKKATRFVDRLEKENPDHPVFNLFYGPLYSSTGENKKGIVYARKAVERTNRNPNFLSMLATFLARDGQLDEAKKLFVEIKSRSEDSFISRDILSRLHFSLGNDEIGFDMLSKARGEVFGLASVRALPHYAFLYDDDRYWELLDEMKIPLLPSDHPGYTLQEEWLQKKAAKALLAAQPKPVRKFEIDIGRVSGNLGIQGVPAEVALSRDGKRMAYAANLEGEKRIYVRELDETIVRELEGTEGAWMPFFSPDGNWIGFQTLAGKLKKVAFDGGGAREICDSFPPIGGTWLDDDTIIFTGQDESKVGSPFSDLFRVPSSGGIPELITEAKGAATGEYTHCQPVTMVGLGAVLFGVAVDVDTYNTALLDLETGKYETILRGARAASYSSSGHIVFYRDNALWSVPFDANKMKPYGTERKIQSITSMNLGSVSMPYAISNDHSLLYMPEFVEPEIKRQLVWLDRNGQARDVQLGHRPYFDPRVSPDGTRIVLGFDESGNKDIWVHEIARENSLIRVTTDSEFDSTAVWDRDSASIFFGSTRGANFYDIYRKRADGVGDAQLVLASRLTQSPMEVSPDGNTLLFNVLHGMNDGANRDIGTKALGREAAAAAIVDTTVRTIIDSPLLEDTPRFSPDGKWIVYAEDRGVWVRPFPDVDEGKFQVSVENGTQPTWSPDGSEIFYRSATHMMSVPVETEPKFAAESAVPLFDDIYFRFDEYSTQYDIADTSDGIRFLMMKEIPDTATTKLVYVENWLAPYLERK